jgi:hypothetical protein
VLGFKMKADVDLSIKGETGFEFEAKIDAYAVFGKLEGSGLKVTIATKVDVAVGFKEKSQTPPNPKKPPKEKFREIGKQFSPVEAATLFEGELYRFGPESRW